MIEITVTENREWAVAWFIDPMAGTNTIVCIVQTDTLDLSKLDVAETGADLGWTAYADAPMRKYQVPPELWQPRSVTWQARSGTGREGDFDEFAVDIEGERYYTVHESKWEIDERGRRSGLKPVCLKCGADDVTILDEGARFCMECEHQWTVVKCTTSFDGRLSGHVDLIKATLELAGTTDVTVSDSGPSRAVTAEYTSNDVVRVFKAIAPLFSSFWKEVEVVESSYRNRWDDPVWVKLARQAAECDYEMPRDDVVGLLMIAYEDTSVEGLNALVNFDETAPRFEPVGLCIPCQTHGDGTCNAAMGSICKEVWVEELSGNHERGSEHDPHVLLWAKGLMKGQIKNAPGPDWEFHNGRWVHQNSDTAQWGGEG